MTVFGSFHTINHNTYTDPRRHGPLNTTHESSFEEPRNSSDRTPPPTGAWRTSVTSVESPSTRAAFSEYTYPVFRKTFRAELILLITGVVVFVAVGVIAVVLKPVEPRAAEEDSPEARTTETETQIATERDGGVAQPSLPVSLPEFRTVLQDELSIDLESSPLLDGTPRLIGENNNVVIGVYGSGTSLSKVEVLTFLSDDASTNARALTAMLIVAKHAAPSAYEWLIGAIGSIADDYATRSDDDTVTVSMDRNGVLVTLTLRENIVGSLLLDVAAKRET